MRAALAWLDELCLKDIRAAVVARCATLRAFPLRSGHLKLRELQRLLWRETRRRTP